MSGFKARLKRVFPFFVIPFLIYGSAGAITQDQLFSIVNNTPFYDPSATACSLSAQAVGTIPAADTSKSVWNSNTQPPYYLEQYIINILQDIAQTLGLPQADTVTQAHVDAMVAWAWKEGGNSGNNGNNESFNVWNTGLSIPSLLSSTSTGAFGSFKSFDAGVEANTISMLGSYQSRIGAVLSDPNSSAQEVLYTIAYYQDYAGNLGWTASASPSSYYNDMMVLLAQTATDYNQMASIRIGPGQTAANHVPYSDLQFSGVSQDQLTALNTASGCSGGGLSAACNNGSGTVSGDTAILCAAEQYNGIYYLWGGGHNYSSFISGCPLSNLSTAASSSTAADPGPCATDCSGLVSVALNQAFNQTDYSMIVSPTSGIMEGSGSQYWQSIPISQAQAGDIVTFYSDVGGYSDGHVEIVDHVSGNTIYTFGSHYTGSKTSQTTTDISYWNGGAYRWTGPGSGL